MHVGFLMAHVQGGQHMSGLPVASCPHNPITWMILGSQILFRNPRCNLKSSRWVRFTDYNYIYIISELVEAINEWYWHISLKSLQPFQWCIIRPVDHLSGWGAGLVTVRFLACLSGYFFKRNKPWKHGQLWDRDKCASILYKGEAKCRRKIMVPAVIYHLSRSC